MKPGKPETKYRHIAAQLRAEILRGDLAPQSRVPPHAELVRRFRTTPVTIQKALDLLADTGWVQAKGWRGTFVKQPKTARREEYALAFPWPRQPDISQFYRALQQQAAHRANPRRRISCFFEIPRTDSEDSLRLAGLVRAHRVAGVIFASPPHDVEGLPVLEEPGVPRVMIASAPTGFSMPCVGADLAAFFQVALDRFAAAGRRRVAVITLADRGVSLSFLDRLPAWAAARGLQTERRWMQGVPAYEPEWARHAAELLFQPGQAQGPDALLITDDNLVPAATAGVRAAGADVLVIAHTNFPYPTPAAVPVTRLGFDISHLLELCIERIDQQRRGETPPAMTTLPPVFEDEVQEPALLPSATAEGVKISTGTLRK